VGTIWKCVLVAIPALVSCGSCDPIEQLSRGRGAENHGDIRQDDGYIVVRFYQAPPPRGVSLLVVTDVPRTHEEPLIMSRTDWNAVQLDGQVMGVRSSQKVVWKWGEEAPREDRALTDQEKEFIMGPEFYGMPVPKLVDMLRDFKSQAQRR